MPYKLVFIGSTGGAVLSRLLSHQHIRTMVHEVVSDRACGFLQVASQHHLPVCEITSASGAQFSDALWQRYGDNHRLIFISFYTRLFSGVFLEKNQGLIFNNHPSLLPSFKGMQGFEDTLNSSALFMGCSFHQVDAGIDSGKCVIQAALPLDRSLPQGVNRHKIFIAQYYVLLQFIKWLHDERFSINQDGRPEFTQMKYDIGPFSPCLDSDFFTFHQLTNELF